MEARRSFYIERHKTFVPLDKNEASLYKWEFAESSLKAKQ